MAAISSVSVPRSWPGSAQRPSAPSKPPAYSSWTPKSWRSKRRRRKRSSGSTPSKGRACSGSWNTDRTGRRVRGSGMAPGGAVGTAGRRSVGNLALLSRCRRALLLVLRATVAGRQLLEKDLVAAHQVQVFARTLLDRLSALLQAAQLGRKSKISRVELGVDRSLCFE